MIRVVVDALALQGLHTGIGRYVSNLYTAMTQDAELSRRCQVFYFDGVKAHRRMPPAADPQRWAQATAALWRLPDILVTALRLIHWLRYEAALRRLWRREGFDVYHETAFCPAALSQAPIAFTLHDLSLLHWAHTHPRERVWFNKLMFPRRLPYATHIITVSHFVRREVMERLHWPAHRVSTILEAAAPGFRPQPKTLVDAVRRRFALPERYLLFVGSLEPRKNLAMLLQALTRCRERPPLVLVGWNAWGDKAWLQRALAHDARLRVVCTGYVDDLTVAALYTGAQALIYPSLYEGFGLPIVEAMACGCPVICSNTSAMPEVAGDAAGFVNPRDPDAIAKAVDRVLADKAYAEELRRRGARRAAQFSWTTAAQRTLDLFASLAEAWGRRR